MKWLALVITLGLAGCNHWVEMRTPVPELLEESPPPRLRLATASGQSVVMVGARFYRDTLAGLVERQTSGEAVMSALIGVSIKRLVPGRLAVQDVLRVEARRRDPAATAAAVVVGTAGVVAMAVVMAKMLGSFRGIANTPLYVVRW
jgi:hypothetical protein